MQQYYSVRFGYKAKARRNVLNVLVLLSPEMQFLERLIGFAEMDF